jgi:uncharacterized protein (DUF1501 family)
MSRRADEPMPRDLHAGCTEHARAARAGAGLPAVEPGMPAPAGTGLSRRALLLRSAGLALAVYGGGRLAGVRAFEDGVARAAAGPPGSVLLSVFLDGGVDALSVLAPVGDPDYRRLRPKLGLREGEGRAFAEDPRLAWHPSAAGFADLHAEGKLSVLPAVGYSHPDQSHFTSRHFWEVGALDTGENRGWMGRLLDRIGTPDNPLQGVSLSGQLSPALAAGANPVAAVDDVADAGFWTPGTWNAPADGVVDAFASLGRDHLRSADPAVAQAARAAAFAGTVSGALAPLGKDGKPASPSPVPYPQSSSEDFPTRLAGFAAMLAAGLPIRCAAIDGPGTYDTHSDQAATLPKNLKLTADALLAFQRDLEARGLADRVLTLVWSEFGRRAQENESGTDHGAAGMALLMGTRASGRMIGEFPGLAKLDGDGNVRATADFRGLYGALAGDWFGVDPAAVLPGAAGIGRPVVLK